MTRVLFGAALALSSLAALQAAPISSYAGQELRDIKALSSEQVADLRAGRGAGQARAAELNSYPGPLHVIEHADELGLTDEQLVRTQEIFAAMKTRAVELGNELIDAERALDVLFKSGKASRDALTSALQRIGSLQGQLRGVHLQAHVDQVALLDAKQLERYAQLRGYTGSGASQPEHGGSRHN